MDEESLVRAAQALLAWQSGVGEEGYTLEDMDVLPHLIEDLATAVIILEVADEVRDRFKCERDEAREELARLQNWEVPLLPGPGESYDELHREY